MAGHAKKNGRRYVGWYPDKDAKGGKVWTGTRDTPEEAEAVATLAEIESKKAKAAAATITREPANVYSASRRGIPTLAAYMDERHEKRKKTVRGKKLVPSTLKNDTYTAKHILGRFGNRGLWGPTMVRRREVQDFVDDLDAQGRHGTAKHVKVMMHGIYKDAILDYEEEIEAGTINLKNPVHDITTAELQEQEMKVFQSLTEAEKLITFLYSYSRNEIYGVLADLLLGSGLRFGEGTALRPSDFQKDRYGDDMIRVARNMSQHGGEQPFTKTKKARSVPIPAELAEKVKAYVASQRAGGRKCRCDKCEDRGDDTHIFIGLGRPGRAGHDIGSGDRPLRNHSFDYVLRKACERMGIQVRTAHDFRRTYATWMDVLGVSSGTIRDLLGHADLSMTNEYVKSVKVWEIKDWKPAKLILGTHRQDAYHPADARDNPDRVKALRHVKGALTTALDRGATDDEKQAAFERAVKTAMKHGIALDDLSATV